MRKQQTKLSPANLQPRSIFTPVQRARVSVRSISCFYSTLYSNVVLDIQAWDHLWAENRGMVVSIFTLLALLTSCRKNSAIFMIHFYGRW